MRNPENTAPAFDSTLYEHIREQINTLLQSDELPLGTVDRIAIFSSLDSSTETLVAALNTPHAGDAMRHIQAITEWSLATPEPGVSEIYQVLMGDIVGKYALPRLCELADGTDEQTALMALECMYAGSRCVYGSRVVNFELGRRWQRVVALEQSFVPETINSVRAGHLVEEILSATGAENENIYKEHLVQGIIQAFGLDEAAVISAWHSGTSRKRFDTARTRTLSVMTELEQYQPGLTKALADTFGIKNFGRYSPDLLIDMYREHIESNRPYLLVLQSTEDYNDAFHVPHTMDHLNAQLQNKGFGLKIYECGTELEAYKAALHAKWRHKQTGAFVAGVLVSGHGKPQRVILGVGQQDHLSASRLRDTSLEHLATALAPGARVVFNSCSAGKENNKQTHSIAYYMARALGVTAISPRTKVAYSGIRVVRSGRDAVNLLIHHRTKYSKKRFSNHAPHAVFNGVALRRQPDDSVPELVEYAESKAGRFFDIQYITPPEWQELMVPEDDAEENVAIRLFP